MSYLILYAPITLLVLVVLETCRQDDPLKIARASARNFALLTLVLFLGSVAVFFVNRYA